MIRTIPTEWLERCLDVMAMDPETAQPSVGLAVRPYLTETHRLMCGACGLAWHPIKPDDPDDLAWYGRCAACGSADLLVESEPTPEAPRTSEWHLACNACGATWVGIIGEPCSWCEDALERQQGYQIDLLLTPPDVDPDDGNHDNRMEGWQDRMFIGIEAGLITEQQARTAWDRAKVKGRAA